MKLQQTQWLLHQLTRLCDEAFHVALVVDRSPLVRLVRSRSWLGSLEFESRNKTDWHTHMRTEKRACNSPKSQQSNGGSPQRPRGWPGFSRPMSRPRPMSWAQGASQKKERRKAVSASSRRLPFLCKGTGTQLCTSVIHAGFASKQAQDVQHDCKDGRDFNLKLS